MLTVREVARLCQVHEVTVRRHILEGRLKAVRVGKGVRVRKEDFDQYLRPADVAAGQPRRPVRVARPLGTDDAVFGLVGIVHMPEAAGLAEHKYAAFAEAFTPDP